MPPYRGAGFQVYKPEMAQIAKGAVLFGATQRQLAEIFNVTEVTIINWIDLHPEFADALKEADNADLLVMGSFYKRARGYDVTTRRTATTRRVRGGRETFLNQEIVETTTHIPADISAAKQWLRLRRAWGEAPVLDLEALFKFAEAARAEVARRGLSLGSSGSSVIEDSNGGSGADESADAETGK